MTHKERRSIVYQPAKIPNNSRKVQQLSRLESEHQRNQNRIRQLHRRNREIEEEIRHLSHGRSAPKTPVSPRAIPKFTKSKSSQAKSLRRIGRHSLARLEKIQIGRYSILFWLQITSLMTGVAIVSGIAGFLLTRLVASLVG
jgi:hypothetical protein